MYLALEVGTIDLNTVFKGAVATILYFLVGMAVLVLGFIMVDVLTPGKLRQMVFVDRRPNAVVLACYQGDGGETAALLQAQRWPGVTALTEGCAGGAERAGDDDEVAGHCAGAAFRAFGGRLRRADIAQ